MNIDALRENFQRHGALAGMHDLTKKAVNRVVPTRVLRVLSLTPANLDRSFLELPERYEASFQSPAALAAAARDPELMLDEPFVRAALARGDRCFGIREGEELVCYAWYSSLATPIDDALAFRFDPAWAYMYKAFTRPDARGRRLHCVGMAHALERVAAEGRKGLVCYVESNNFASLKASYRVGYQDVGTIVVVTFNGKPMVFTAPTCRDFGATVDAIAS